MSYEQRILNELQKRAQILGRIEVCTAVRNKLSKERRSLENKEGTAPAIELINKLEDLIEGFHEGAYEI